MTQSIVSLIRGITVSQRTVDFTDVYFRGELVGSIFEMSCKTGPPFMVSWYVDGGHSGVYMFSLNGAIEFLSKIVIASSPPF